ncbi:MAG: hypothetical protein PHH00_01705 [Candidatus Nanoarchaeia archaeon]|nr:hypothetical protein [Candidatus Nanoarchaeia archaeon]
MRFSDIEIGIMGKYRELRTVDEPDKPYIEGLEQGGFVHVRRHLETPAKEEADLTSRGRRAYFGGRIRRLLYDFRYS